MNGKSSKKDGKGSDKDSKSGSKRGRDIGSGRGSGQRRPLTVAYTQWAVVKRDLMSSGDLCCTCVNSGGEYRSVCVEFIYRVVIQVSDDMWAFTPCANVESRLRCEVGRVEQLYIV